MHYDWLCIVKKDLHKLSFIGSAKKVFAFFAYTYDAKFAPYVAKNNTVVLISNFMEVSSNQ